MAKNVSKIHRPLRGTRLGNFIASGGNPKDFESCKGFNKSTVKSGYKNKK